MQLATGVDMAELRRVRKLIRNPRFLPRFFGAQELEQYRARERRASVNFIAGNFCAKEAFAKALGTGIRGFSLRDIQVLRDSLGAPYFYLTGMVSESAQGTRFSLSITHTREYAVAFVVAWKDDNSPESE